MAENVKLSKYAAKVARRAEEEIERLKNEAKEYRSLQSEIDDLKRRNRELAKDNIALANKMAFVQDLYQNAVVRIAGQRKALAANVETIRRLNELIELSVRRFVN